MDANNIDINNFNENMMREDHLVKLRILELFFLRKLVDDPIDGSEFDCDILDMIKALKKKYADKP